MLVLLYIFIAWLKEVANPWIGNLTFNGLRKTLWNLILMVLVVNHIYSIWLIGQLREVRALSFFETGYSTYLCTFMHKQKLEKGNPDNIISFSFSIFIFICTLILHMEFSIKFSAIKIIFNIECFWSFSECISNFLLKYISACEDIFKLSICNEIIYHFNRLFFFIDPCIFGAL